MSLPTCPACNITGGCNVIVSHADPGVTLEPPNAEFLCPACDHAWIEALPEPPFDEPEAFILGTHNGDRVRLRYLPRGMGCEETVVGEIKGGRAPNYVRVIEAETGHCYTVHREWGPRSGGDIIRGCRVLSQHSDEPRFGSHRLIGRFERGEALEAATEAETTPATDD